MDLAGRHYLVTGAGSGIGRAVATLLAERGATTSLVDVAPAGLEETASRLPGGRHGAHVFDLRATEGIEGLVASVVSAGGLLHGVVHAAGIQQVAPVRVLHPASWREIFAVNTEAGLALAKTLSSRKVYAGSHGAVVFISSVIGLTGSPGAVAYSMSKSALHGMTRSLALDLAPRKIRVNCVAPGFVRTPLLERTERLWTEDQRRQVEARHPLGFGEPEDVANAVAFLVADTGRWITGTVLVVDGGYLAQ
ncbi:MAG: SDR family NAD(P)-dependent oxidoreductase [Anaeromyxobacteraceae bacterium]